MIKMGIDAGGTLIKVAFKQNRQIAFKKFPTTQMADAAKWMNEYKADSICLTGGKSTLLKTLLNQPVKAIVEFDATCDGVRFFLQKHAIADKAYILTNVGTGTSIHYIDEQVQERIGGTGVGGGTLMGLSYLLTGIEDFAEIVHLAANGSRERIDLTVGQIYEGAEPPISGDLTASNFGNIRKYADSGDFSIEERLASVIGIVGETAATTSVLGARQYGISSVIYIGSSFINNSTFAVINH